MSTRALATARPDCPGGGIPPSPRGSLTNTERTAALLPKHGSRAMGLGTVFILPPIRSGGSSSVSKATFTEAKGRLAICCISRRSCSLRLEAQQLCLIFQTTAATRSKERKQLNFDGPGEITDINEESDIWVVAKIELLIRKAIFVLLNVGF